MLFKYVSKPVFLAALTASGFMYILAKTAWAGLDEAVYRNPFLLMIVYVFYVWLILPFNVSSVFAVVRNPRLFEYRLVFAGRLAALAALYEGFSAIAIGMIGLFIGDDFAADRVAAYLIFLFLNLNALNAFHIALCDKFKIAVARTITFSMPVLGALLNNFGGSVVYRFNFFYFGMRGVSPLNVAIVYIAVFGGCYFLMLKKGKREYA